MTIKEQKAKFKKLKEEFESSFSYEQALKVERSYIDKLDNIILDRNAYSEELRDMAVKERENKHIITSALHSLIREGKDNNVSQAS